jgi:hypothetical protein
MLQGLAGEQQCDYVLPHRAGYSCCVFKAGHPDWLPHKTHDHQPTKQQEWVTLASHLATRQRIPLHLTQLSSHGGAVSQSGTQEPRRKSGSYGNGPDLSAT